jgi:hypothetical protein
MKKSGVVFSLLAFFLLPTISLAAQVPAPATIVQAVLSAVEKGHNGDAASPDKTPPWRVDQGGTGATSFTNGSILFYWNGFAQDNPNIFWDGTNHILDIGTNTVYQPISRFTVKGATNQGLLNLVSSLGISKLFVDSNGNVGIGNTTPHHKLDVSGAIYSRLVTATSGSIDWNAGNVQSLTLSSPNTNITFTNGQPGGEYTLILKQDAAGGRTVTWPSSILWAGGTAPTLSSGANATDVMNFVYNGTNYLGSAKLAYASTPPTPPPPKSGTVAVLVVAGGGGGGGSHYNHHGSGGGGAGGYQAINSVPIAIGSYAISVGAGGSGGPSDLNGSNGGNSSFGSLVTSIGGGGGSAAVDSNGGNGGSGGGASGNAYGPGIGTPGQGNSGGTAIATTIGGGGGGGGGASNAGANTTTDVGAAGGNGTSSAISGSSVTYAGGGGGGDWANAAGGIPAAGGAGGGGAGGVNGGNGTSGMANTGSGGGGAASLSGDVSQGTSVGGAGGSGIVIISYPTGSITATGGTVTTAGGSTIHFFTSSGIFMVTTIH